ncbi:hypothetical protein ACFLX4_00450 [Chloroflexota bacterium]
MRRCLNVFIVVLLLVTASGMVTCGDNNLEIYKNIDLSYSIGHPAGWRINDEKPDIVYFFHSDKDRIVPATITIMVISRVDQSLDKWVEIFIQEYINDKKEGIVLQNDRPKTKWSRKLGYWYVWKDVDFQCEAYFIETIDLIYTVFWEAPVGEIEICETCQRSASTFTISPQY